MMSYAQLLDIYIVARMREVDVTKMTEDEYGHWLQQVIDDFADSENGKSFFK